jgi:HTH-type transcriptional regulator/antitoxin MqsA
MRHEKHDDVLAYKDQTRTIKTLGWWCTECGESILTGEPLVAHARALQELKAHVDGVLSASEVTALRETIGLSQRKAGELLGGGPRSFQKYESGLQTVSVPMAHLLRLLAKDPRRVKELPKPPAPRARVSALYAPRPDARPAPRRRKASAKSRHAG